MREPQRLLLLPPLCFRVGGSVPQVRLCAMPYVLYVTPPSLDLASRAAPLARDPQLAAFWSISMGRRPNYPSIAGR